jgi:hypothetical protein
MVFAQLPAFSQGSNVEICNDNIDNDGNGLIDCADPFCQFPVNIEKGCHCFDNLDNDGDGKIDKADSNCATYYGLTFIGDGSNCSITPPGAHTPFDLVGPPAVSGQNTADTQSKVAVGDVDNDGIPDVVITSKWNSEIRVVATSNGQPDGSNAGDIKADYNLDGSKIFSGSGACDPKNLLFEHEVLIADIDKDGKAELFGVVSNRQGSPSSPPTCFFLVGFRYGSPGPGGLVPLYNAVQIGTDRPGTFGVADMDGDGKAEIYLRDRIYAAETGKLLAAGNGDWDLDVTAGPVAVNISGDTKMELVCGTKIFSIPSLTNRNPGSPAALTLSNDMNAISPDKCFVKLMLDPVEYGEDTHSACSVADIDRDGVVDVVISGALNSVTGKTAVFLWNVAKNKVSYYIVNDPAYANGWPWGTGRVNLGDANGDGRTDLSFISGNQLFCLTTDASGNLTPLWAAPRIINDSRSGVLTVTIYDFDNDGHPEMVYRDSQEIVIIDGTTGTQKLWSSICQSHTYTEGPVIADANGDGGTDICVSCNRNNSFNINAGIQQQALGEVRMFYSTGNEWLPTRKVWNQPGYFVVNINDDLTLPFPQMDQNLVFSNSPCPNGLPGPQMPMNVFLNQVPFLSADGCPVFPAPDLSFVGDDPENLPYPAGDPRNFPAVVVVPPICGNLDIKVSFNIINDGDLPISSSIPVSFFNGDPTKAGIKPDSLLFSTTLNVVNLQVGDTLTTAPVTFNGPGTPFRLYIVLNNNGSVLPINPNGSVSNECRIDNNIYDVFVTPDPFTATIEKIKDNFKCSVAAPDNGELRAHIFKGATEVTDYSPYAFAWRNAANAIVSTNYNATGLPAGTYSLVVTNTQKGCSSVPVYETLVLLGNDPDVSIIVKSHQTQCSPPNGQLEAVVAGGNTGYTFAWYDIALTPLGITGSTASNLTAGNYLVYVSKDGCTKVSPPAVIDGPQIPDAQAQTLQNVVNCINPNSGSITADALFNTVVQDPTKYKFDWYFYNSATNVRGSILPPVYGTGKTRTGLPVGSFQVVITEIATQCVANQTPIAQVTDQTVLPTALITQLAPQTSCDLANPNGRLAADVQIGGVTQNPSAFTFQWFKGDNTLPANLHTNVSDVNGRIAEKVPGGGVYYTVKVTTANNCSDTEKIIITEDVNVPVVTLTPVDNSICDPALAATAFNGKVTASVTFKGVAVTDFTNYQFKWYDGSQTSDPAITVANDKNPLLSQLDDGFYTVTAKRLDLSCLSTPVTAEVKDGTVLPVITASTIPSKNCDPLIPSGSAAVTDVDGLGTGSPYSFKWYNGNTVVPGSEKSVTASYPNLNGGPTAFFTVLVTNQNSGCQSTSTVQVADARVLPLLSLTPSPNTICDPTLTNPAKQYDGQVLTTITNQGTNPIADYTFAWSNSATTKDLLNVKDASYTLTVTQTSTRCVSNPVTAQVLNQTALPVIDAVGIASTNCIPSLVNGQALVNSVDTNPAAAPYIFLWHKGVDLSNPLAGETNALLDKRQGGVGEFYTVLVTNQAKGCRSSQTVEIPDKKNFPVITLSETDNTICAGTKDGTASLATLTFVGAPVASPYAGYSFHWSTNATTASINQLAAGFYTLDATKDDVGCTSAQVQIEVKDNLFIPPVNVAIQDQTSCDVNTPNGMLTPTIDETSVGGGGSVIAGYSFLWKNNGPTLPLTLPGTTVTTTTATNGQVNQLAGNLYYTVQVTRSLTGCVNTETVFVPETIIYPQVVVASTNPVTRCDVPNGAMQANVGGATSGYTFYWVNEVGTNQTGSNTAVVTNASASFVDDGDYTNLIPGFYTVVAKNNATTCLSQPVTREVINAIMQTSIAVTLGPGLPSTCGSLDGEMTATVTGGSGGTVDLFWHYGGPQNTNINFFNNPPQFAAPNDVPFVTSAGLGVPAMSHVTSLESKLYTLVVRDNGNGCGNYETVFLPFVNAHSIAETLQPSTICPYTIGNGEIDVAVNNIPAVPAGLTFQDFSYGLYTGENPDPAKLITPPGIVGPGGAVSNPMTYASLAPGKYTIEVRQEFSSRCPIYKVVEIKSLALPPVVDIVGALKANTACDLNAADGSAEIAVSQNPSDVTVGFPYTLVVSPAPSVAYANPLPAAGNFTIGGLRPGTDVPQYSVKVTSSNQCVTERFITIPNQPAIAEMVAGDVIKTDAEYCLAALEKSARIEVTNVSIVNGPADNLSDYRFNWYTDASLSTSVLVAMGNGTATEGGEILSNDGVSPAPSSPVTIGSYWIVSTKVNPGTTGGVGCFSAPFKVDIDDNTVDPALTLTPSANTSCDTNYEGQIEVDVSAASGPGISPATYQYAWTLPAGATTPSNATGNTGVNNLFTGVKDGLYTLTATNQVTGCFTTATASVVKLDIPVVIAIVNHKDQDFCTPNGEASVVDVRVNGSLVSNNAYFDFTWFNGSPTGAPALQGLGADVYPNLSAGTYYAVASVNNAAAAGNIPGSGCKSPPVRVDVIDVHVNPTTTFNTVANTACDNNFDGKITVLPATASGPGNAATYDLTWTSVPSGSTVANATNIASPYSTVAPDVVGPGPYTVHVLNRVTQCFVDGTVSIINAPQPVEILTVNKTDQLICYPDGSIAVTAMSPATVADYTFRWFRDDPNSTPLTDAGNVTLASSQIDKVNYPTMGADTYYIVGIKNPGNVVSSGCTTPPFRVDVLDLHEDPRVQFTFQPNSSCDPMNPNGVLLADAAEANGTNTATYTIGWTLNGGALPGVTTATNTSNSSQLDNAFEGNYGVVVTNTSVTGCAFTTNFVLDLDQTISLPNIINVDTTDPLNCLGSGSAQVTSISIGGGPPITGGALATGFEYEWYATNFTPADKLGATTPALSNLQPGSFFVLVRDLQTMCKSAPTEVVIDDKAIVYPVIDILQTAKQISCSTTSGSAVLLATADGQNDSNPNYQFTWYNNLVLNLPVFATTSTISNLLVGDYSLEVFNAATGCKSNAVYTVPDDAPLFLPAISLGGQPLTRCIMPFDGAVSARIVNDFQGKLNTPEYPFAALNFTAEFYTGTPPTVDVTQPGKPMVNLPGFTLNWEETNLVNGMYTVKITDNNTGCYSFDTEAVDDGRVKPTIDIVQDNPLTNCDPFRANGQLSATADGGHVGGYTFDWYDGSAASGAILVSNNKLIGQAVGDYTVRVTSGLTGCFDDKTGNIMDSTLTPPIPTALVVRDRTSCVTPNGWVTANVKGMTFNYTFNWYDGAVVQGGSDFTGIDYQDRDIGPYTVTATDQVTGCVSPPATVAVADKRIIPLLKIESTPSYCLGTGRDATGSVLLTVVNDTDVTLDEILWYNTNTNDNVGSGSQAFGLYPGYYYANVVSSEGCEATAETEVKTEILSYNLVSVNNDSRNDVWIIDCIDNFPDNNVKVFNRTGILVYEGNGYNNSEVVFKGFGEKGIYISGRELPDGTYFYIIDKRDGSKPIVGYLELVR